MAGDKDRSNKDEFDELVASMQTNEAITTVGVIEVADTASMVEFTIPISEHFPHPEVTLMETIAEYLSKTERRALVAFNPTYELRNGGVPFLIATIMLTQPV